MRGGVGASLGCRMTTSPRLSNAVLQRIHGAKDIEGPAVRGGGSASLDIGNQVLLSYRVVLVPATHLISDKSQSILFAHIASASSQSFHSPCGGGAPFSSQVAVSASRGTHTFAVV